MAAYTMSGNTGETQTPLEDLIRHAVERMEQGARMRLDAIPGDTSLSSSSHGPEVVKEIARRLRIFEGYTVDVAEHLLSSKSVSRET